MRYNTQTYLAELIRSQLENRVPAPLPAQITPDELLEISEQAHMNYVILGALIKTALPETVKERLRPYIKGSIMQTLAQLHCLQELCRKLEERKIKYQVMKGAVLKYLYPSPELREMSDLDVHIFAESLEQAGQVARELGFELKESVKHHDVYMQPPYLVLELHNALYDKSVDTNQYEYFKNHQRLHLKAGSRSAYEFSREDFYVYMISHMGKHFYETGCGIRNLMDIYVYYELYRGQLDQTYLARELKACGTQVFEREVRTLAYDWLEQRPLSRFQTDLLEYMIQAGIYGKDENGIWNKLAQTPLPPQDRRHLKLWYYLPPVSYLALDYPLLERHKWCLPLVWIYRGVKGLLHARGGHKRELLREVELYEVRKHYEIYAKMQLNFRDTQK